MIVALTGRQWNTVANRIPAHWRQAMKEHRSNNYGQTYSYDLPAICWRRLFDHLSAQATGPMGGFTQAPEALYSALSKIIREVMKIEQHPALTPGLAVTGSLPDIIPAWETRPTRSCYPTDEAPFVLLVPRHFTERGWALTTWISGQQTGPGWVGATERHEWTLARSFSTQHSHLAESLPDGEDA